MSRSKVTRPENALSSIRMVCARCKQRAAATHGTIPSLPGVISGACVRCMFGKNSLALVSTLILCEKLGITRSGKRRACRKHSRMPDDSFYTTGIKLRASIVTETDVDTDLSVYSSTKPLTSVLKTSTSCSSLARNSGCTVCSFRFIC